MMNNSKKYLRLYTSTFFSLVLSITLITTGCDSNTKETESFPVSFENFDTSKATEKLMEWDYHGIYIYLPECFYRVNNRNFSLSNENNFSCDEHKLHFSADFIKNDDMPYYRKFYERDNTHQKDELILLDYVTASRTENLSAASTSIHSIDTTFQGNPIYMGAVRGQQSSYSNQLYYQFGVIKSKPGYYVLQVIANDNDIQFYHSDILEILKSTRIQ